MRILSHRGYWRHPAEKNQLVSFARSFTFGFGAEIDIRDCVGRLVISHDPASPDHLSAEEVFSLLSNSNLNLMLAINIKADGLQVLIQDLLRRYSISQYFLFDMSTPDAFHSISAGLRVFSRQSDLEPTALLYEKAVGIWMDAFFDDSWISPNAIKAHLHAGKQVCIVSPELHGRPFADLWERIAHSGVQDDEGLMLCTDNPEEARDFFSNV